MFIGRFVMMFGPGRVVHPMVTKTLAVFDYVLHQIGALLAEARVAAFATTDRHQAQVGCWVARER
ncbi:MAG: hypothetical protein OXM62_06140 [bacterium]|nr:hypothetical protein [bacterium]MDE0234569.1 hypothetical protein [bacterium]